MPQESDREPGLIALARQGVHLVGWRGALQTAVYGLRKARLDRKYLRARSGGPEVRPGAKGEAVIDGDVARIPFGPLSLEVAFVDLAFVRLTWTPGRLPVSSALADGEPQALMVPTIEADGPETVVSVHNRRVRVAADGAVVIEAQPLRTRGPGPGDWQVIRSERPPLRVGDAWTATVELAADDQVHGLGERAAPFDLRPGSYGLWNTEQSGSYGPDADPLYLTIPVALIVAPGRAHLAFWENSHRGEVVVGETLQVRFEGGALRTYACTGPPDRALVQFHTLTGRSALPPRWALGYHQCRWGYRTEADIREVLAGFHEHDLPLSAIHFDIDYMDRYRVFTINERNFPDLAGLISDLNADGVQAVTILDPGVARDDGFPLYREGVDRGHFLKLPDGREANAMVWPGMVGFPDFTDPDVRAWWGSKYPALLDKGVGGIWHDMCEPAVFAAGVDASLPLATRHDLEGQGGDHVEGRNLYGLGMARCGWEAQRSLRPDRRPWLLTRSGWAGVQRYAWTWTGDVATSWTMLGRTISTALNLSLSGVPYTGPDIGGFSGDPSPELYTRWFQMAAWLPFFRSHSIDTMPSREPWNAAGPHLDAVRDAMAWRYRLLPYLYTLAWAHSTNESPSSAQGVAGEQVRPRDGATRHVHSSGGDPLILPVWWPESTDPDLLAVDDEFLVGPKVLVAPVLEAGATSRTVRLPPGRWFELGTGVGHEGVVTATLTLDRIPVYVRAGAVLPADDHGADVLHVYPPDDGILGLDGLSFWYRDEGDGYGPHRLDHLVTSAVEDGVWTVTREVEEGSAFEVDDDDLAVVLHGGPWTVSVDGGEAQEVLAGQPLRVGDFAELVVRRAS